MRYPVEALYSETSNPITSLLALEGIRCLASALPALTPENSPDQISVRSQALYGAWLCGSCLGSVGISLHHKLCHTLGGSFNLPHAEVHTIVLPHALAYNAPALSPEVLSSLANALPGSEGDAVKGLNVLLGRMGVERKLSAYGMKEEDIDKAADLAVAKPYPNPRTIVRDEIREVIRRAWAGEEARVEL